MVLTNNGYRPIEAIMPGELVATHLGRFRPVLRVGSKVAAVGVWKAVGVSDGITCTPDHPFYVADDLSRSTRVGGKPVRISGVGAMNWRAAENTPGAFWSSLIHIDAQSPDIPQPHALSRADTMKLLGWYLGDGWIRTWDNGKKAIVLGLSQRKVDAFRAALPMLTQAAVASGSTLKIAIGCTDLCKWIEENIGHGAASKTIPGWLLGDPDRSSLLEGYVSTDGSTAKNGVITLNSVSEALARGTAALAETLSYAASVTMVETPELTQIEGRIVSQRNYFQTRLYPTETSRKSLIEHGYMLRKVQSFCALGNETVFNIEVDEDNSFVLNGAIVHNCQAFSVAGARRGLEDERGNLTLAFVSLLHEFAAVRPGGKLAALWENVPGVLSDKGNAFGCFLGGIVGAMDAIPSPAGGTWPSEGMVEGPRARVAWCVLDAQWFGVAQRRRRVFAVIDFGRAVDPAAVLLEPDSMRGNSPPRREAGPAVAALSANGVGASGPDDNQVQAGHLIRTFDRQSSGEYGEAPIASTVSARDYKGAADLVAHTLRGEGFDASEDGTGRGTPLVPVAIAMRGRDDGAQIEVGDDCAFTLRASTGGGDKPHVLAPVAFDCKGTEVQTATDGSHPTLRSMGHSNSHQNTGGHAAVYQPPYAVRRLTPTEALRLQGFPDGWTAIERNGKPAADGPQYKAIGNSMAVPCIAWILERMRISMGAMA